MTEDLKKLVESGEWFVGVWDLQFYVYNHETAEELKDCKGKVRTFRSEVVSDEMICPDVEDLEEVWIPDLKKLFKSKKESLDSEEAKRPPIDENLEKVILGAFKKVFPEIFTPTDTSDVDVVSEDLMWVGFKDYDIRVEKDPEFNDGHLQISVHSKKDEGYMLHQEGEPCKLIVREENENE